MVLVKPATTTWKSGAFRAFQRKVSGNVFNLSLRRICLLFLSPPCDNSAIDIVQTHPFSYFSQFLTCTPKLVQKVATAFPRLPVFFPRRSAYSFFFLICSFTLFHFSLPSSFHLINKHTLQPTFIEQLGSSVPSHFLTIHRVL